jgi:uncharacterized protein YggL (DUF469 family)
MNTMNRRMRKKKRVGEFRELGFELSITLVDTSDETLDVFMTRAIDHAAALGLSPGGGGAGPSVAFFVTRAGRGGASEQHREALTRAIRSDAAVRQSTCGPLIDAWHGPFVGAG